MEVTRVVQRFVVKRRFTGTLALNPTPGKLGARVPAATGKPAHIVCVSCGGARATALGLDPNPGQDKAKHEHTHNHHLSFHLGELGLF